MILYGASLDRKQSCITHHANTEYLLLHFVKVEIFADLEVPDVGGDVVLLLDDGLIVELALALGQQLVPALHTTLALPQLTHSETGGEDFGLVPKID